MYSFSWVDFGEFIKAVSSIVTASAAIFGAHLAYKGVEKWRIENLGKKKADLAEEVLSGFYHMEHIIESIRSPFSFGDESAERPKLEGETESQARNLDTYYVPVARLEKRWNFISDLMAKRYRMNALFGKKSNEPFEMLEKSISEIRTSANMLLLTSRRQDFDKIRPEHIEKWTNAIWKNEEADTITPNVLNAIEKMEEICQSILLEKR